MGDPMFLRLRQLALVAHDLDPIVEDLHAIFGMEVAFNDPGVITFGLRNAVLPCDTTFLEIVSPVKDGTTAGRYLERRNGDGGYMVILQCSDHAPVKERVDRLGIRKVVDVFEHEHDYAIMQLHPRDTGGSFLEIDVQGGGEDLMGPWMPAGRSWQTARRDEIVRGITAAEVQSDDPAGLAARWSEILERPVRAAEGGVPTIDLDNASLRFVEATDGRGEGLGGMDIRVTDVDRVRSAAESRGRLMDDNVVALGGIRIRLVPA
jgi:hypothetical protein